MEDYTSYNKVKHPDSINGSIPIEMGQNNSITIEAFHRHPAFRGRATISYGDNDKITIKMEIEVGPDLDKYLTYNGEGEIGSNFSYFEDISTGFSITSNGHEYRYFKDTGFSFACTVRNGKRAFLGNPSISYTVDLREAGIDVSNFDFTFLCGTCSTGDDNYPHPWRIYKDPNSNDLAVAGYYSFHINGHKHIANPEAPTVKRVTGKSIALSGGSNYSVFNTNENLKTGFNSNGYFTKYYYKSNNTALSADIARGKDYYCFCSQICNRPLYDGKNGTCTTPFYSTSTKATTWDITGDNVSSGVNSLTFSAKVKSGTCGTDQNGCVPKVQFSICEGEEFTDKKDQILYTTNYINLSNGACQYTCNYLSPAVTYTCRMKVVLVNKDSTIIDELNDTYYDVTARTKDSFKQKMFYAKIMPSVTTMRVEMNFRGDVSELKMSITATLKRNGTHIDDITLQTYYPDTPTCYLGAFTGLEGNTTYSVSYHIEDSNGNVGDYKDYAVRTQCCKIYEDSILLSTRNLLWKGYGDTIMPIVHKMYNNYTDEEYWGPPGNNLGDENPECLQYYIEGYHSSWIDCPRGINDIVNGNGYLKHNTQYRIHLRIRHCFAYGDNGMTTSVNDSEVYFDVKTKTLSVAGEITETGTDFIKSKWQAYSDGEPIDEIPAELAAYSSQFGGFDWNITFTGDCKTEARKAEGYLSNEVVEGKCGIVTGDYQLDKTLLSSELPYYYCVYEVTGYITDGVNVVFLTLSTNTKIPVVWIWDNTNKKWLKAVPYIYDMGEFKTSVAYIESGGKYIQSDYA